MQDQNKRAGLVHIQHHCSKWNPRCPSNSEQRGFRSHLRANPAAARCRSRQFEPPRQLPQLVGFLIAPAVPVSHHAPSAGTPLSSRQQSPSSLHPVPGPPPSGRMAVGLFAAERTGTAWKRGKAAHGAISCKCCELLHAPRGWNLSFELSRSSFGKVDDCMPRAEPSRGSLHSAVGML